MIPSITVAGTTSGVGKTCVTLGILYKLKKMRYRIQSFKVGPDFIDPSYHSVITHNYSYNLDTWLMGKKGVLDTFERVTKNADIAVIEGVMGLYDGAGGKNDIASTSEMVKILQSQVILVIDCSKAARSIAAMAYGYILFDMKIKIAGIILNNVASKRHYTFIKDSFANKIKAPIIGVIYRNNDFVLSERHLGLIPVPELEDEQRKKAYCAAKIIADCIKIDEIIDLLNITKNNQQIDIKDPIYNKKPDLKVAVALDSSFNFYYRENLDRLRENNVEIVFFSPIKDKKLPQNIGGIIIGGGFPEILSKQLSENRSILKEIKKAGEKKEIPIYAECGGLMYLTKTITEKLDSLEQKEDKSNKNKTYKNDHKKNLDKFSDHPRKAKKYDMVGLIDATTEMTRRLVLNYTKAEIITESIYGKGGLFKGHEFHFSKIQDIPKDSVFIYKLSKGNGIYANMDGLLTYNTLASYMHLHFSNNRYAERIVNACRFYLKR